MITCGLSDHLAITFSVNIPIKAPCKFRQVNTQKIHKIKITDFREDIVNSDLIKHPHTTASLLSHQYFNTLGNILDKHAPIKMKMAPLHPEKIHKIKITDFREDIVNSDLIKHPHTTASLLSHQYFNTLGNILDKHAPIKMKMAPLHPDKGFVNSDILSAKRLKRKCERVMQ